MRYDKLIFVVDLTFGTRPTVSRSTKRMHLRPKDQSARHRAAAACMSINTIDIAHAAEQPFKWTWVLRHSTLFQVGAVSERFVYKRERAPKDVQGMSPPGLFLCLRGDTRGSAGAEDCLLVAAGRSGKFELVASGSVCGLCSALTTVSLPCCLPLPKAFSARLRWLFLRRALSPC